MRRRGVRGAGERRNQGDHPAAPAGQEGHGRCSVRGLRKERSGHRGLRPRVLIPGLLAALAVCAALAGCSGRTSATASRSAPGAAAAGTWFQLQAGSFQPVADPASAAPAARRPWTVQSRVADMAFLDDTLYCARERIGTCVHHAGRGGQISFDYHADPLIFAHRTITTLIPRQGTLAVHLYFNALLNDARQQDLSLSGISLVSYSHASPTTRSSSLRSRGRIPTGKRWDLPPSRRTASTSSGNTPTPRRPGFATRGSTPTRRPRRLSTGIPSWRRSACPRSTDRRCRRTWPLSSPPCRAEMPSLSPGASLQFSLRSRESPVRRNYRSRQGERNGGRRPGVRRSRGRCLPCSPDGRVLGTRNERRPAQRATSPALPRGVPLHRLREVGRRPWSCRGRRFPSPTWGGHGPLCACVPCYPVWLPDLMEQSQVEDDRLLARRMPPRIPRRGCCRRLRGTAAGSAAPFRPAG